MMSPTSFFALNGNLWILTHILCALHGEAFLLYIVYARQHDHVPESFTLIFHGLPCNSGILISIMLGHCLFSVPRSEASSVFPMSHGVIAITFKSISWENAPK